MLATAMFLPVVGQTAERHPRLKLIVDHMGVLHASSGEATYRFQPELLGLLNNRNIAVKATGQAGCAEDDYPFRSLHPHLHRCFDAFGPERMFRGTDITCMRCSWRQCVTLFTEELPWLNGRDLELVMGEAVSNWLGWALPAAPRVNGETCGGAAASPGQAAGRPTLVTSACTNRRIRRQRARRRRNRDRDARRRGWWLPGAAVAAAARAATHRGGRGSPGNRRRRGAAASRRGPLVRRPIRGPR
jgi:hypothetical protein